MQCDHPPPLAIDAFGQANNAPPSYSSYIVIAAPQTFHNQLTCRKFISPYPAPTKKELPLHLQYQVLETQKKKRTKIYTKSAIFPHPLCNFTFSTGLDYLLKPWNFIRKPSYLFVLLTAAVGEEDLFLLLFLIQLTYVGYDSISFLLGTCPPTYPISMMVIFDFEDEAVVGVFPDAEALEIPKMNPSKNLERHSKIKMRKFKRQRLRKLMSPRTKKTDRYLVIL